jgi:hypothetical protein
MLLEDAKNKKMYFDSLLRVGFTAEQAIELTKVLFSGAIKVKLSID